MARHTRTQHEWREAARWIPLSAALSILLVAFFGCTPMEPVSTQDGSAAQHEVITPDGAANGLNAMGAIDMEDSEKAERSESNKPGSRFWSRFVPRHHADETRSDAQDKPEPAAKTDTQPMARLKVTLTTDGSFTQERSASAPAPARAASMDSLPGPELDPEPGMAPPSFPRVLETADKPLAAEPAQVLTADSVPVSIPPAAPDATAVPPAPVPVQEAESKTVPAMAEAEFRYRVRAGDQLSISIPYEPDTTRTVPVQPDGYIRYLFDIEVLAAGKTYKEIHDALLTQLKRYYKNPRVTVIGTSFQGNSVFVMGPVTKPGPHVIHRGTRLLDILASAGVLSLLPQTDQALEGGRRREIVDLSGAYVARNDRILEVDFEKLLLQKDLRHHNIPLLPGDFIFIPSSLNSEKKIYIVGSVDEAQVYYYTGSITFMEAMLEAGGSDADASNAEGRLGTARPHKCYIVRKDAKQPMEVNWAAIQKGRMPDIALKSGDIIYVPERKLSVFSRTTTGVIREILAPLKAVLDMDNTAKDYYRHDWEFRKK